MSQRGKRIHKSQLTEYHAIGDLALAVPVERSHCGLEHVPTEDEPAERLHRFSHGVNLGGRGRSNQSAVCQKNTKEKMDPYRNEEAGQSVQREAAEAAHHDRRQIFLRIDDRQPETEQIAEYRGKENDQPEEQKFFCFVHLTREEAGGVKETH